MKNKAFLNHFEAVDKKMYEFMLKVNFDKWFNPRQKLRTKNYFLALCREIIGQQLSGKAANSIFKKFIDLFNGEEHVLPKNVARARDEDLRNKGLSWAKVKYVKDLAAKVNAGVLVLEELEGLSDEEVVKTLTGVKGIGPWTAEMFMIFTLGRENVFSYGDLRLKKGFEKVYKVKDPTYKKMEKVVKRWEPYKTYASITLWSTLDNL